MQGLSFRDGEIAGAICREAFDNGLIIETSGADNQVVKCLCPLTISIEELDKGLDILQGAVNKTLKSQLRAAS